MGFFAGGYFGCGHWSPTYWGREDIASAPPVAGAIDPDADDGAGADPGGRDFPFVRPSADVAGLLVDAWLCHDVAASPPLRVASLVGLDRAAGSGRPTGPAEHPADVRIVDSAGATIFDSTAAHYYRGGPAGGGLWRHEWRSTAASCMLLQRVASTVAGGRTPPAASVVPTDGRLDARCSSRWPGHVSRLSAGDGPAVVGPGELAEGYNVGLVATPLARGRRRGVRIVVSAAPGGGLGAAPGCEGDAGLYVRSIRGQLADEHGNLTLDGGGCTWVRRVVSTSGSPRVATPVPATLQLGDDCTPCRPCVGYEDAQRDLLTQWDRYEALAAVSRLVAGDHSTSIARWKADKLCRDSADVRLNALPYKNFVEVVAGVCNTGAGCLTGISMRVGISTEPDTAWVFVDGACSKTDGRGRVDAYRPLVDSLCVTINWDLIPPGGSVVARFRLQFPVDSEVAVSLTASALSDPDSSQLPGAVARVVTTG